MVTWLVCKLVSATECKLLVIVQSAVVALPKLPERPFCGQFSGHFCDLPPPQFVVVKGHNIWEVTVRLFVALSYHSSLRPIATIIVRLQWLEFLATLRLLLPQHTVYWVSECSSFKDFFIELYCIKYTLYFLLSFPKSNKSISIYYNRGKNEVFACNIVFWCCYSQIYYEPWVCLRSGWW